MTESFRCSSETITTLLISYTPVENKKLKKKKQAVFIHYSILAWEIPWTEDPGGLQLVGVSRVGHNLNHHHHP